MLPTQKREGHTDANAGAAQGVRRCLNTLLCVLANGGQWRALPRHFGPRAPRGSSPESLEPRPGVIERVFTRVDKLTAMFLAFVHLAFLCDALRQVLTLPKATDK